MFQLDFSYIVPKKLEESGVTKYSTKQKSSSGYMWTFIDNASENITYKEMVTYTQFDGLTLLYPEVKKSDKYEFECEHNSEHFVINKCNINGHAYKVEFSEQLIKPSNQLVE